MPYRNMMGDYYTGDYYRGDPFLGALIPAIGGLVGKLFKRAPKLPTALARVVPGMIPPPAAVTLAGRAGAIMRQGGAIVRAHPAAAAGAAAAGVASLGVGLGRMTAPGPGMRGFHLGRRGQPVRNRRMRVTNVKALHRSLRRIGGFARVARRVLHFTHPKLARGRPHFRFKRKASR